MFPDKRLPVGKVIGIDRSPIHPIEGTQLLGNLDFTTESAHTKVQELINGKYVDIVLSDMAPSAIGIKSADHDQIIELAYYAVR